MALPDEEMPGTRPSGVTESGPIMGLTDLQPEIDGYDMEGALGEGAMGAVYAATDANGRAVAIKVLHDPQPDEMTRRRFDREVAALKKLDHPGVPEVYDSGQLPDGRLFLIMERLHGITLEDWYDQPGHTRLQALELIVDALDALAVAHVRGVVHRDIKPENLFVLDTPHEGPKIKILDFGIALHRAESETKRTATGISVGTPCYMSPEQAARPKLVGAYSDVWSIGVVLYEALCGELPFDGETAHGVVVAICAGAHTPLSERSPQTHPDLLALVESCLIKAREDRPINAAELKDAVSALLARDEVRATLNGPAATPDLQMPRSATPFAETEELTDPDDERLAVAATISAQLANAEPAKNRAPILLAVVGMLLGVAVAVLYVGRASTPEPVDEAPRLVEATQPTETEVEPDVEPATEAEVVEEEPREVVAEIELPEPDVVVRPRMRVRPRISTRVEQPEIAEMEVETMEPVAVMESVMEAVPTMDTPEPTMQATVTPMTRPRMRPTRPRMRPTMMRRPGDRPEFVTF